MLVPAGVPGRPVRGLQAGVRNELGLSEGQGMREAEVRGPLSGHLRPEREVRGSQPHSHVQLSGEVFWESFRGLQAISR